MRYLGQVISWVLLLGAPLAGAQETPVYKPHAVDWEQHRNVSPVLLRKSFAMPRTPVQPSSLTKTVYGYLPYWVSDTTSIPWPELTHLSYFAVELNADGSLGADHGWHTAGNSLVQTGHAYGVKVTLTATLFDNTAIANLLASQSARDAAVANLLSLVESQGGDGINIDFEFVPKVSKAQFVTFITDLSAAFHDAIPGSHVSLATPAVDYLGSYDYDQLAIGSDGLLIMAYGFHWGGGNPGPLSPISSGETWNSKDLRWTVQDYLTWGLPENRHKFVLGFPLYGHDWPTQSLAVPGTRASGDATSPTLSSCESTLQADKRWDEDSQTPYKVYMSGNQPRQLFCEDQASLAAKLDLVSEVDFGGAMFWAIGYASTDHGVWDEVDARFHAAPNTPPVALVSAPAQRKVGEDVLLDGSASYDADGDVLSFSWEVVEGPVVPVENANTAVATAHPFAAGTYRFRLRVDDGTDSATAEVAVAVTADDTGDGGGGDTGGGTDKPAAGPTTGVSDGPHSGKKGGCNATEPSSAWALGLASLMAIRLRRRARA